MRDEPPAPEDQNGTSPTIPLIDDKLNELLVPVEPYLENRYVKYSVLETVYLENI